MSDIGDGTGNEVMVAGALLALFSMQSKMIDPSIAYEAPNAVEFGLDFMKSRYRVTVSQVPDSEEHDESGGTDRPSTTEGEHEHRSA